MENISCWTPSKLDVDVLVITIRRGEGELAIVYTCSANMMSRRIDLGGGDIRNLPTELIFPPGQMTSYAVFSAGLNPTTSMTACAPLPSVSLMTSLATFISLKLRGIQPRSSARFSRSGTESTAIIREGWYSRAHMIAQSATGPQPMTTTVMSFHCSCGVSRKAFLAPLNLVVGQLAFKMRGNPSRRATPKWEMYTPSRKDVSHQNEKVSQICLLWDMK